MDSIWGKYRKDLEDELKQIVDRTSLPMYDMMRYHLGWVDEYGNPRQDMAGKRLRPYSCLHACQSVGGDWKQALPAAVCLELVHNFTLIHDDIQDSSTERRGRATVWHIWGIPQAINVGDCMHVLAKQSLLNLADRGVDYKKIVQASSLLEKACIQLCEGQYLDINYEKRHDIKIDDYFNMISGKTAALFRCSLEIGALLGTDNDDKIARLSEFGYKIGILFQICDDMLGIWGDPQKIGKSNTSDIKTKKKTLPVVFAFECARGNNAQLLHSIYKKDVLNDSDLEEVLQILEKLGVRNYIQRMAEKYYSQSLSELHAADISNKYKDEFKTIADQLIKREH